MQSDLFVRYSVIIWMGGLLLSLEASAEPTRNINQLVGDRALGLGGAYTAISDDPAGMFYNPAGLAFTSSPNMSANVNTAQIYSIRYRDALAGEFDFVRESFQVLPNFFGVLQPYNNFVLGFSSNIIDSVLEKQSQVFDQLDAVNVDRFVFNSNYVDTTYNVGPSIAMRIDNRASVGLSLHLHYRTAELNTNQHVLFLPDDPLSRDISWQNRYEKNLEWGIRPKLGVLLSPVEKWSFGIAVDHTWVFSAARSFQFSSCSTTTVDIGCEEQINPEVTEASIETKYPWSVRLGSAFFPSNALLLSADVIYHSATAAGSSAISKQATLDLATGMEWYWSPKWALRLGAFTSHANTPEVEKGKVNQQPHVDIYGGALSIARFTQGSSISVGVMPRYGLGASQLFSQLESVTQDTSIFAVTTFFTTSYRY